MIFNPEQPSYQILICLIQIWTQVSPDNPMEVPKNATIISEVEEIEIEESYKKLIGTASVKFPRGTIIRKTVDAFNENEAATNKYLDASISESGVVEEVRKATSSVATTGMFNVGQRIRIYLGYTTDPTIAESAKSSNNKKNIFNDNETLNTYKKQMHIMFDGYITKISVDAPIELQCENLASALKQITCPKLTISSKATVNDFLGENAKYPLLKGTGLKLNKKSIAQKYDLGKITLSPDLTVADVLTEWSKFGLHCFVTEEDGKPVLSIGRSYFDNAKDDSIINQQSQSTKPIQILFDYHVASNGLTLTSTDKKFLAIEAEGVGADDKFFHLTLLKNPKYNPDEKGSEQWRVVNVSKLSKKAMKCGVRTLNSAQDRVDMNLYTKIPYHSRKMPITQDELIEEAKKYFESYNMNGIDGTLSIFGDLHLHTATKVELVDKRYPGKNGYYLVEEVHTTFGDGGYRQRIKLPYCIKRNKKENEHK